MIHKFFRRVFSQDFPVPSDSASTELRIILRNQHGVARNSISPCAIKITSGLQQAGYSAFVVGGAVRDLLLGLEPKDFDIVTNATPEEVRAVFRRSRIIGRRFRLVHVMCGAETIEVSTFRGNSFASKKNETIVHKHADEHGRILRDNVFGSQEEDAKRRDFTVNALFYNPDSEEIWDYLDGYDDIQAKQLRIIGTPLQRYREDPVRMLRAVRLAAKLDMQIDTATATPIGDLAPLLQNVPPSRLFDEMLKLLLSGHAQTCVADLRARGLYHGLLPTLDMVLTHPLGERFITLALKNTDERVQQEKTVSPGFLFAALLWHEVLTAWNTRKATGEKSTPALHMAMSDVLAVQAKKLAIPRRYDAIMQEIWAMQPRFLGRAGRRPFRLLEHPRFRAAYDFMLLRCESGEMDVELAHWWETFQHAKVNERENMLLKGEVSKKRRRRRGRGEIVTGDIVNPNKSVSNAAE
ncbi:MAG: polynucleotide adenylyltransferase PcnB [Nitrosomonadaceae bacterium]